jgi:hypothetical protein
MTERLLRDNGGRLPAIDWPGASVAREGEDL